MTLGQALGIVGAGIGFLVGGPGLAVAVGYVAGSLIGNLLDPVKIEGPRITDLKLQLSEYGRPIPIIYGTLRIAGNLMWQTDLQEHKQKGGKGGPEVTNYTYSASLAILLTANYLEDIVEVFADGRKVWPDGDDNFDFTFYQGTEDQLPDPTMEAEIGVGLVPAHRGYAYVVFDDLDLTDFGNRIPQFEFVVSTQPVTQALSIVKSNYATGSGHLANYPVLVDWPASGDIIVSGTGTGALQTDLLAAQTFSQEDLSCNGATDTALSGFIFPSGAVGTYKGMGVYVYANGTEQPLWNTNNSNSIGTFPTLSNQDGSLDFLGVAGVPGALFLTSCALTQDGTALFAFTSAVARVGVNTTHWYKIVDGLVVANGTVSPGIAFNALGGTVPIAQSTNVAYFENNAEWMWVLGGTNSVNIYHLVLGNLEDWGAGTLTVPFGPAWDPLNRFTIKTLAREGYCGAFFADSLVLLTRFGPRPAIPLSEIVTDISNRTTLSGAEYDTAALTDLVMGYAITGQMEARNAIQPLRQAYFFDAVERDGVVVFVKRGGASAITISDDDLAGHPENAELPPLLRSVRTQEAELPRRVYVEYINAAFDYQKGTQYDERQVTNSQSETTLSLPISLADNEAKHIGGVHVWGAYQEREQLTWWTGREFLAYEPTDVVTLQDVDIRVEQRTEKQDGTIEWSGVISRADLYDTPDDVSGAGSVDPGQPSASARARTRAVLLDIPVLSQNDSPFGFYVAMCPSEDGGWPGAGLYKSLDGGSTYALVATTDVAATIGATVGSPGVLGNYTGSLSAMDTTNSVSVTLSRPDDTLTSVTQTGLDNGANLCAIRSGSLWEILQYRDATLISSTPTKTYTLTNFYRGRLGSEAFISGHAPADEFVVLPTLNVDAPESELNVALKYKAVTFGKSLASATAIDFTNTGKGSDEFYDVELDNLDTFIGDNGGLPLPRKGLVPAPPIGAAAAGWILLPTDVGSGSPSTYWGLPSWAGSGSGTSPSTGGSALAIFDEGVLLDAGVTSLDFVGSAVVATNVGHAVTVTISGSGGSSAPVDASYLVMFPNSTLTNERVATGSANVTIVESGGSPGTVVTFDLSTTGVTAATYGDTFHIPQLAVDKYGRITLASNVSTVGRIQTLDEGISVDPTAIAINVTGGGAHAFDAGAGVTEINVPTPAPVDAQYLVRQANSTLTNECVLQAGAGVTFTEGGGSPPTTLTVAATVTTNGATSQSTEYTASGAFTFNVPAGVTKVTVTVVGAGGGGATRAAALGGGGGGSGEVCQNFDLHCTGGGTITGSVGAKGTGAAAGGGTAAGVAGGDSTCGIITARGGLGGVNAAVTGGAGGGIRGGAGGSAGAAGTPGTAAAVTHFGGGGGGGAGTGTGNNGGAGAGAGGYTGAAGGTAAATQGGGGGGASTSYGLGGVGGGGGAAGSNAAATCYGAGGGGAGGLTGNTAAGGNGCDGYVLISWVGP